jgi:hypothetical protein
MSNAERTWRGLPPERDEAAQSTVEALMYELREHGVDQLKNANTQRRFAEFSGRQLREVIERLIKLRPRYPPGITEELITTLLEQTK